MNNIKVRELAKILDGPMVSLYMPTHQTSPENKQDVIRYKNLLNEAKNMLRDNPKVKLDEYFAEADRILNDVDFWNYTTDGLGVLIDCGCTRVYHLTGEVDEGITVGDYYNVIPLINYFKLPSDYYLLEISRDRFRMFTFFGGLIEELKINIVGSFDELYDDKDMSDQRINPTASSTVALHSHVTKSDEDEKNTKKYFRYLKTELERFFRYKDTPIILFGRERTVNEFKAMVDLPFAAIVNQDLETYTEKELVDELRNRLLPTYIDEVKKQVDQLKEEINLGNAITNFSEIERDVGLGRIQKLFIATDFMPENIDCIVACTFRSGGDVVLVDREKVEEFDLNIGAIVRF